MTIHPAHTPAVSEDDQARLDALAAAVRDALPGALGPVLMQPFAERRAAALEALPAVTDHGDTLQYADDAADDLARIVATLAAQPGGVTMLGHHWCLLHDLCDQVDQQLAEEDADAAQ